MSAIDWSFGGSWPYEPRFFGGHGGRLHYVDEGPKTGRPVLLVHGNPTWGYLFRAFIEPLIEAGYRVIVPDLLGFGRSDKPDQPDLYRVSNHIIRLTELLDDLDLRETLVVPHDWGGPISLAWAVRHPERVSALFLLNTFPPRLPAPLGMGMNRRLTQMPGVGALLMRGRHGMLRDFLFKAGVAHPERLTSETKAAYQAPHPDWASRAAVRAFPKEIPRTKNHPVAELSAEVADGLEDHFRDRPVAIAWGMKDPLFGPEILEEHWIPTLPDAEVYRLADAAHYLPEEAPEEVAPLLLDFSRRLPLSTV